MRNDKRKTDGKKTAKEWNIELAKKLKQEPIRYSKREMHIQEATQYFLNGNYSYAIIRACSSKWNYKKRNTEIIFALAKKRFQDLWKGDLETFKAKFLSDYENLKCLALKNGDLKEARENVKEQAKLMGFPREEKEEEKAESDLVLELLEKIKMVNPVIYIPENHRNIETEINPLPNNG